MQTWSICQSERRIKELSKHLGTAAGGETDTITDVHIIFHGRKKMKWQKRISSSREKGPILIYTKRTRQYSRRVAPTPKKVRVDFWFLWVWYGAQIVDHRAAPHIDTTVSFVTKEQHIQQQGSIRNTHCVESEEDSQGREKGEVPLRRVNEEGVLLCWRENHQPTAIYT